MSETTLRIDGMSCQHCVMRVKKAIGLLPGVTESLVDIGTATITYDESRLGKEDLKKAVEEAGYKVLD
jgi:copper chaperone CopZ